MPANRYYLSTPLIAGENHLLDSDEFHHLVHVMRKKAGDLIELVNGRGDLATAEVNTIEPKAAHITVKTVTQAKPALPPLTLIQALLPLPQLKLIVQKATELGAAQIFLFPSAQSEKKTLSSVQLTRLIQTTIAALKQCGRLDLPLLSFLPTLDHLSLTTQLLLFGDLRQKAPLLHTVSAVKSCAMIIGPEKGLTQREMTLLETKHCARGVKLHPYTLRAETAAIAALACLAHFNTDRETS
ncbi:MAG: RsmE family RNA methyltransferase [Chlamydiota bacterium]